MIASPRTSIPIPDALNDVFPAPPCTPLEAAKQAAAWLVAQAKTCQDPDAREHGRHLRAAEISRANKQLARTGTPYSWVNVPGRKQKEYK